MVWNSGDGVAMVIENTRGLSPYTADNDQTFDFTLKPPKNYGLSIYSLPKLDMFGDLKDYLTNPSGFSPFDSELYAREDFCFESVPKKR